MAKTPTLLDRYGRPVQRSVLTEEVAAPTIGGVRSPITGYPSDGLNPVRVASILREADQGDPVRYLELAEAIEERDPHYIGVLGTRRRSVSQIEITVEIEGDDTHSNDMADMVRRWLKRDELQDEMFDILDAIGKGYSFTEIIWDTSEGQWLPGRLEYRDPRWFRFHRSDLRTPLLIDDHGQERALDPFKFICTNIKAKSGIPLRSGLSRHAAWNWMFKAFTQRDWAIFTQTYGQPLRVGKYGAGASEEDKSKLFRAVANIAGDCAAIIPESMLIDFVETSNVGSTSDLYERRSDWLDKQISKAVLGQTGTTDSVTGGLGSSSEHREVQEDIERADAGALAAILNRDLIRPWIDLEYGPQKVYPQIRIARPEQEDLKSFSDAISPLIERGLRVSAKEIRDRFSLREPTRGEEILGITSPQVPPAPDGSPNSDQIAPQSRVKHPLNGQFEISGPDAALQAQSASEGGSVAPAFSQAIADQLAQAAGTEMAEVMSRIEAMLSAAKSLEEFREMVLAGFPDVDMGGLSDLIGRALFAAHAGGRAVLEDAGG